MDDKEIFLDDAAQSLFAKIDGIEEQLKGRSAADMMAESLAEEQKQQDVWRILLCEIVHHIAGYLQRVDPDSRLVIEQEMYRKLSYRVEADSFVADVLLRSSLARAQKPYPSPTSSPWSWRSWL